MARVMAEIVLLRTVGLQWNLSPACHSDSTCRPSGPYSPEIVRCVPTAMAQFARDGAISSWLLSDWCAAAAQTPLPRGGDVVRCDQRASHQ